MAEANDSQPDAEAVQMLRDTANRLRIHSIKATSTCSSGHPMSCCSAAEILSVLFFHTMRYKQTDPEHADNDRFVLSKGHAVPVFYATWAEVGDICESDLLSLRKLHCDSEGHPTPRLSFVDVATGSLGQGLGAACGMAYTGKYFDKASYRVFCLMGDGESAEGSVWEALAFASHYSLDNVNRLGQSGTTPLEHRTEVCQNRREAFGWNSYIVDGHDVEALCQAFWQAAQAKSKPTAVIAKTFKGEKIATRKAYGMALAELGHVCERVIALDSDTKNSTFSDVFQKDHPEHFIECFIAEQNMENFEIGQAKIIGSSVNDKITVIGAGVTLHEALAGADDLSQQGISIPIINPFTVKPLDAATFISSARATGGWIITVGDHCREGGIGEAVCAAVSREPDILVHQLAVAEVPRSGKASELLDMFGISAKHIITAVKYTLMN
ncbi:Transketolase-like protein 2 [Heterocephalus glaber]|uniref:transketolase n=1 Tax=Heterocephalus glaber TaxID=10181 RepID=G5BHU9_HETGA|nr:Transketolase-like protein 2 [Heterocephalus glaber]